MPIEKAVVNVEDRGYQFGDAVYEFLESFNGHLFCLEEHLDRLENSLKSLYFPHVSRDKIRQATIEMLNKSGFDRTEIYIQISRGVTAAYQAEYIRGAIQSIRGGQIEAALAIGMSKYELVRYNQGYKSCRCRWNNIDSNYVVSSMV